MSVLSQLPFKYYGELKEKIYGGGSPCRLLLAGLYF